MAVGSEQEMHGTAVVHRECLEARAFLTSSDYRLDAPRLGQPLLQGRVETCELQPGLVLHCVDVCNLQSMQVVASIHPGLHLALVVGGRAEVRFGSRNLSLSADRVAVDGAAAMVSLTRPDQFHRIGMRGVHERTVSLLLRPEWLRSSGMLGAGSELGRLVDTHLGVHRWRPSSRAQVSAVQLLQPPPLADGILLRYLEARALDIVVEAVQSLADASPSISTLDARSHIRMVAFKEWLDSGGADEQSLADMARQAGMSVNTLQRHFRAAWGTTVFAYLKESRMARARRALEHEGVRVAHAAWIAGYTSAANFSTAFRRRYQVSPGMLRSRVSG